MRKNITLLCLFLLAHHLFGQEKFIVFYSRPPAITPFSVGGHAFVSWVEMDSSGRFNETTMGFYPKSATIVKTLVIESEGKLVSGFDENRGGNLDLEALEVAVSDSIFQKTRADVLAFQASQYQLFTHNCLALMHQTARMVGLKTPSTRWFLFFPKTPTRYLRQLKRKNRRFLTKK